MTEANVQEILALAISAHRDGNFQEAEKYYTSILNAQPNHADANHNMGVLAVQFNKVKLSLPFFRRALDANDNVLQFWHSYLDALVKEGDRDLGLKVLAEAKKRGLRSEVLDTFTKRLNKYTEELNANHGQHQLYETETSSELDLTQRLGHFVNAFKLGQFDFVVSNLKPLTKRYPLATQLHELLGASYAALQQGVCAVKSYKRLMILNPHHAETSFNLANALKDNGEGYLLFHISRKHF